MLSREMDGEPQTPYCDGQDFKNERTGCVNGRTGVGPCLVRNYTILLPQEYQVREHPLSLLILPQPHPSVPVSTEGGHSDIGRLLSTVWGEYHLYTH